MNEALVFIQDRLDRHHEWFSKSLPMIASENLISPLAREMMLVDFQDRYAEGLPGERYYQGNVYVDEVEVRVTELAKRLFRCRHADVRPISGTNANLAVLFALGEPGHVISTVALSDGAHISTAKFGAVGVRGMKQVTYPFDAERMNLDVDGTIKVLRSVRPEIALFGQSVFLFPTPLKELRDEKMEKRLLRGVFPGVVSNHHLHAMAALGVTLAEHLEFGRAYAEQVVRNAKALATALHARGLRVLAEPYGFTESHIVAVDVRAHGGGAEGRVA